MKQHKSSRAIDRHHPQHVETTCSPNIAPTNVCFFQSTASHLTEPFHHDTDPVKGQNPSNQLGWLAPLLIFVYICYIGLCSISSIHSTSVFSSILFSSVCSKFYPIVKLVRGVLTFHLSLYWCVRSNSLLTANYTRHARN